MAFVVETGAGLAAANSYATEGQLETYCEDRGLTVPNDAEQALVRSTAWIDGQYGGRFPGSPEHGRAQGLEWPRINAMDRNGNAIATASVPPEVVEATCAAAVQVDTLYSSSAGGAFVTRERIGSIEVEYASPEPGSRDVSEVTDLLAPIIGTYGTSGYVRRAIRA